MKFGILRRIRALERWVAPNEAERVPRLPEWYVRLQEAQGLPPIDELGRPDSSAMERIAVEKRTVAESISTEESRAPDLTQAIKAGSRFD